MEQRNKVAFLWVPAFVLFLFCTYAEGAVYKCPTASGGFIYSNKPCLDGHRKEGNGWINVEEENRKEKQKEDKRARQAQPPQKLEPEIMRP